MSFAERFPRVQPRAVLTPPPALAPASFAARLYNALGPLAQYDPTNGWSLLILCNAIGQGFQLPDTWLRDTPDGPGWSLLLDVNRCPTEALGWLAQLVGVRLLPGASDSDSRHRIANVSGWWRGTPANIQQAAWRTLTGQQRVYLYERDPDAYALTVVTYSSETPDPAATEAAILAQKPAGIVLTYICQTGQVYSQVVTRFATYAALDAAYADYALVLADEP
jgi:hypothetical protein